MNRNTMIIIGIIAAVVLLLLFAGLWYVGTYNSFVQKEQGVEGQWAQVQTVLQRRYDLIPNLVETVRGYAAQEKAIFDSITEARALYTNNPTIANANAVETALGRLLVVVEDNPEIKSNENFLALQDQLEGTENRIAVERQRFNDTVREYNTAIKVFPGNIVAGMNNFTEKEYFEAAASAQGVPPVDFT